jgi:hypothetical protein
LIYSNSFGEAELSGINTDRSNGRISHAELAAITASANPTRNLNPGIRMVSPVATFARTWECRQCP